ncbi:hypothetical protein NDU88_004722 [Pleurodeles waltl]|uniref:Uncharacterized protein n=1 Tax=Pleurodeles waltl TaxID=8319 RepID=A0AAV7TSQ8_PLEWA|nr:hypothetical protein NDU88_004722 [Pleurodeles waltl]
MAEERGLGLCYLGLGYGLNRHPQRSKGRAVQKTGEKGSPGPETAQKAAPRPNETHTQRGRPETQLSLPVSARGDVAEIRARQALPAQGYCEHVTPVGRVEPRPPPAPPDRCERRTGLALAQGEARLAALKGRT